MAFFFPSALLARSTVWLWSKTECNCVNAPWSRRACRGRSQCSHRPAGSKYSGKTWSVVSVAVHLFQLHPIYVKRSSLRLSTEYFDVELLVIHSLLHFWSNNCSGRGWWWEMISNVPSLYQTYSRYGISEQCLLKEGSICCVRADCVQQKPKFSVLAAPQVVCSTTVSVLGRYRIFCFQKLEVKVLYKLTEIARNNAWLSVLCTYFYARKSREWIVRLLTADGFFFFVYA